MHDPKSRDTHYLTEKVTNTDAFLPVRATGPLNEPLPWVLEFRVVGTAAMIQAQVNEEMFIGRADATQGLRPAVDLGPHGGQSKGVSRKHAALVVKDNRIYIRDLGSVNGTRLNGSRLAPQQDYRLRHGDEIEVGTARLQVRFTVVPTIGTTPKGSTQPLDAPVPMIGKGEHIVIAESDAQVSRVFSMALKSAGFRVTAVETAAAVMAQTMLEMPQLIILDLMLPDMHGIDLIRYIRKQPNQEKCGIVVCSGSTGGFQMHQALEAGAKLFLGKPVSVEDLMRAVTQVMEIKPAEAVKEPIAS